MTKLDNQATFELCMSLLRCDTEREVEKILRKHDLWFHEENWRLLGDSPANWSIAGNQQAKPVPALVEKLVNSIDAVLISKCLENGIDPKSDQAPENMLAAVEKFFDVPDGLLENLPNRTQLAQNIHLVCTGLGKMEPCYTIIDSGEGQTPGKIHSTFLSLPGTKNPNKKGIPFVQGIFNMGGTGVSRFCGEQSLQLIITKRNPKLLSKTPYEKDTLWSFTVLRRRSPTKGRSSSYIEYLAPVHVSGKELKDALTFGADSIPALPKSYDFNAKNNAEHAYAKPMTHGTCIKLYEYKNPGFRANIQLDLYNELNRHFYYMALPIRLEERRLKGYAGKRFSGHSFDTTLAGMNVRLEDTKIDLVQKTFHGEINVDKVGELDVKVHVLQNFIVKNQKTGKMVDNSGNYHRGAEIQVLVNGQQHGLISKALLSRKTVGLDQIAHKLFIILDATKITNRARESLFMASRDRLSDGKERFNLEQSLIDYLGDTEPLTILAEEEKQKALEKAMKDTSSLEEIFKKLVKQDPVLAELFPQFGPVIKQSNFKWKKKLGTYKGKKVPTFFRLKDDAKSFNEKCPINKSAKIVFEHDAENDYFRRTKRPAKLTLFLKNGNSKFDPKQDLLKTMSTAEGITNVRLQPLADSKVGDKLSIKIELADKNFAPETIFKGKLKILQEITKRPPTRKCDCECHQNGEKSCPNCIENHRIKGTPKSHTRTKQPFDGEADEGGMSLPKTIPVHEDDDNWAELGFTKSTGCKIRVSPTDFLVYVNVDNEFYKKQIEYDEDPEYLAHLYQSAMAMCAVGMYHKLEKIDQKTRETIKEYETKSPNEKVADASDGLAMVLLPIITKLGKEARKLKLSEEN